jgi:MFS superfamily sulfate permease-like transporter
MTKEKPTFLSNIKHDIPAAIVVFLVALPLCLGIALASGAPLFSGIIAGIVGGIAVALISGSPLGVSGPAAGLVVIVVSAIDQLGTFEAFLLAVVVSGVMQILLGVIRAGIIGYYFPSAVIKGMLSGIGIIIILKQIPHAVGYDADPEGDWAFVQPDGHTTLSELAYMLDFISPGAVIITLISLTILILWEQDFIKKLPGMNLIQGPLVAVVAGILLNLVFKGSSFNISDEHTVGIPVAGTIGEFLSQFTFPDFSMIGNSEVYVVAFTIAIVASLETLLCVEATDKLDPQRRVTPANRELVAQGIGNMFSGLIGGLPITQVIVRSSANIQSGGKSKASAFFHGILLLLSAMFIPRILNLIPLASLASVLFVVGYKLAKPSLFKDMYERGLQQFIPYIITILGLVFTDLLIGVSLGLFVGIMQILWNNYKTPYHFDPSAYVEGQPVQIQLSEDVTFLNKASILQTLNHLPDGCHIVIDGSKAKNVHPDVFEIIEDFEKNAPSRDIKLDCVGFDDRLHHDPVVGISKKVLKKPVRS